MNELERELFALLSAEEYGTRIRKAGVYLFPSDYRFDPHAHLEYEINYINTGHCIMSVGEDYVALRQGECIVVAPGMLHGFMVDGQKPCRITQLELVIRGPERTGGILEFPGMAEPFHRLRDCEGLLSLLERAVYYHRAGELGLTDQTMLDLTLLQLYAAISEAAGRQRTQNGRERNGKAEAVLQYINEHLDEELNIERLAREHGISSRYLRRYFLQCVGMGSNEYIAMLRIGRAKRLLWRPEYSVTDVAMRCGFSSSQYFCRVFRRMVGQTPAQYRGKWRESALTEGEDESGIG